MKISAKSNSVLINSIIFQSNRIFNPFIFFFLFIIMHVRSFRDSLVIQSLTKVSLVCTLKTLYCLRIYLWAKDYSRACHFCHQPFFKIFGKAEKMKFKEPSKESMDSCIALD